MQLVVAIAPTYCLLDIFTRPVTRNNGMHGTFKMVLLKQERIRRCTRRDSESKSMQSLSYSSSVQRVIIDKGGRSAGGTLQRDLVGFNVFTDLERSPMYG
jgi:hypothetical protein